MLYRLVFLIALTLGLAGYVFWSRGTTPKEALHYHAGFLVFKNGSQEDFSDFKYMELEPCTDHGEGKQEDDQKEKAHLHDGVGDVVHVHRAGAVWGDLFKNISYTFPSNEPVTGYLAGEKVENILRQPIEKDESVIIVIGDTKNVDLAHPVTLEHIHETESKSETCGTSN